MYAIKAGAEYLFVESLETVGKVIKEAEGLPLQVFGAFVREPKGADQGWFLVDTEGRPIRGARQLRLRPLTSYEAKTLGVGVTALPVAPPEEALA